MTFWYCDVGDAFYISSQNFITNKKKQQKKNLAHFLASMSPFAFWVVTYDATHSLVYGMYSVGIKPDIWHSSPLPLSKIKTANQGWMNVDNVSDSELLATSTFPYDDSAKTRFISLCPCLFSHSLASSLRRTCSRVHIEPPLTVCNSVTVCTRTCLW